MENKEKGKITRKDVCENRQQLRENIKKELFVESFLTDDSEFSTEKIDHLIGLLEIDEPTDKREIEKHKKEFEQMFKKTHKKEFARNALLKWGNRAAAIAAVLMLTFMAADLTTNAVMDESLFHMIARCTDRIEVIPGVWDIEDELADFSEKNPQYFDSIDEFAEYFGNDFLFCSWLPDGVKLEEIFVNDVNEKSELSWKYINNHSKEWKMQIWMQKGINVDTASVVGDLKETISQEKYINGIKVIYYKKDEGLLAGFEYQKYWYLIDISSADEEILMSVIEGMETYEVYEN